LLKKGETVMELYLGVDFHPHLQRVCWVDPTTGEIKFITLRHDTAEVQAFYQQMPPAIVGVEATSQADWFELLLLENNHRLVVGNPKLIRARASSRHKSDSRDAELIFDLLRRGEFPALWRRPAASTQILEILRLRSHLVRQRTQTYNRLQAMAHSAGLPKGRIRTVAFQDRLKQINLEAGPRLRRDQLLALLAQLDKQILELEDFLHQQAADNRQVKLLLTQRGVGDLTALALVHTLGDVSRFGSTRQITAFIGLDPVERSSGGKQKFGGVSKAGSPLTRFLLGQAANIASRFDPYFKSNYKRLAKKKPKAVAKTATARKLLVKLSIMLRDQITAQEFEDRGRTLGNARRVQGPK
jgi:transposase